MRLRSLAAAGAVLIALAVPALTTATQAEAVPTAKGQRMAPCAAATKAQANTGFTCDMVYVPQGRGKEVAAKIDAAPSMESAGFNAAGGEGGTCSLTGCYHWYSSFHSGYDAVGSYGWRYQNGSYQLIGTIYIEIDDYLQTGTATKIAPFCWSSTHGASNVYLIAEMYWATSYGSNGQLSPRKRSITPIENIVTGKKKCLTATGNSNGYGGKATNVLSDTSRAIYTTYHYMTWGAAGFPGKWYAFNKSWVYGRQKAGDPLKYYSPVKNPVYANDANWLP